MGKHTQGPWKVVSSGEAGGGTIMKADVEKIIRDWQSECSGHPSMHNQGNVLLGKLKALQPSHGWLPIDTAPKDGTEVLVWRPKENAQSRAHVGVDFYSEQYRSWYKSRTNQQPTHWMPLPTPPVTLPV